MIDALARLSVKRLPLHCLQVKEHEVRYPDRLTHYIRKLRDNPGHYAGVISVVASDTHPGMFCILDGHHRFCASVMAGRKDMLCLVVED